MSAYTSDEKGLAAKQFGPKDPSHAATDLGPVDRDAQFQEIQSIVAWGFISNPDIIYSFVRMAIRVLLERNGTFLTHLTELTTALADMQNDPSDVEGLDDLDDAIAAAREMKTSLDAGGDAKAALSRFSGGLDDFLTKLGNTSRAGGVSRTPRDEAVSKATDAMSGMESLYRSMLTRVTAIRNACTDWDKVDLSKIAGADPASAVLTRLEEIRANPSDRQRAATLELLSSIARMDAAINPRDPCVAKVSSTGAGGDSTGESHQPKALLQGSTSAPHNLGPPPGSPATLAEPATNPGNHKLKLELNEGAAETYTLPSSTRASSRSRKLTDVTVVASGPASMSTPGTENFDFEIDTGGPITATAIEDDGVGAATLVVDSVNNPFANAKAGDLVHPDGEAWANAGRILHVISDDRAVVDAPNGLTTGDNITVFRDNRLTLITDGVAETATLDLTDNHPYTAAKLKTLLEAAFARAKVEVNGATVKLTSDTGIPDVETSLVIAPSRANSPLGWTDDPEAASPYPDPNPNVARGSEGNDHLVLAVDEPLYAGNPLRDTSATPHAPIRIEVAGTHTLAAVAAHLNGQADFAGDANNPRAYAEVSDGRLVIRSQRFGATGTVRIIDETFGPTAHSTDVDDDVTLTRLGNDRARLSGPDWTAVTNFKVGDYVNIKDSGAGSYEFAEPAKILELESSTALTVRLPEQAAPPADGVYEDGWALYPALRSTCLDLLGLSPGVLERGVDVSNEDLKTFLEDTGANPNIDGDALVLISPSLSDVKLRIDSAGVITVLSGSPAVGQVARLEGDISGVYHVATVNLPAITLTPGFASLQLPASGSTVDIDAKVGTDLFTLESAKTAKDSALKSATVADGSNSELGLTDDQEVRGRTDVWDDSSVDLVDKGVIPTDLLTITGDNDAKEIGVVASGKLTLKVGGVTATTDNDTSTTYTIKSKGLTEQDRIAKDLSSPLPDWQDNVLTGDDGFQSSLGTLRDALNRAVNGEELQRRRAVTLAGRLSDAWGDGPGGGPSGLKKVLATYEAPILAEAEAILQALQDMSMERGTDLLRQARFVDFFNLSGDTSLASGDLIKGLVDLAEDFAVSSDALREGGARSHTAPSPDADYLHDDLGGGYRVITAGVDGEAEDVEEVY